MRVPSSAASRSRSLRLSEGNGSPSGGNPRRWSTQPIDHSTGRHDPAERLEGFSSAALEPLPQPATHALPSQQSSPSTPECKERNHRYKCRSGWAGRVMRSTVHEARQGEAREPMRVRWLLRTAHSRRYVRTRSRMLSNASECAADCARARGVHARWQPTSCKIDPRVDFTRHSKRARGCLMAGCDRTWQEIPFAARPGGRSLPACRAITLTTICVTTQRAETSGETTRVHALFKAT
jgi:hypothetical protein